MDLIIDVDVELFHNAGGLGLDLDFGDGLNFACGHDGAGDVSALNLGDAIGVDLRALDQTGCHDAEHQDNQKRGGADPDPELFALLCRGHLSLRGLLREPLELPHG